MSSFRPRIVARCCALLLVAASMVSRAGCAGGAAPLDPNNQMPFGWMDAPEPNAAVKDGKVSTRGWALDDGEVKEMRFFVDGRFKVATPMTEPREDLKGPYPAFMRETNKHGWKIDVEVGTKSGAHTLIAQAIDDKGLTHDIASIQVSVP